MDFVPTQDVYANVLASSLWATAARVHAMLRGSRSDAAPPELSDFVGSTHFELAAVNRIADDIGGDRLRDFLLSPDLRDITIALCLTSLFSPSDDLLKSLERRFLLTLSWFTSKPESAVSEAAYRLFTAIRTEVDRATRIAVETRQGFRSYGDDELFVEVVSLLAKDSHAAAQSTVSLFSRGNPPRFSEVIAFVERVRSGAAERYGRMEPPDHSGLATISLEELYIAPTFRVARESHRVQSAVMNADELLGGLHRAVVLGNPGAGKSSFARAVCHTLATEGEFAATPFLVELRDYAERKESDGVSIADYLERLAKTKYQADVPDGAIGYLLASGRAVVIFDGLDELLDTRNRADIRSDIEVFARQHPFTRVLVTSREVGYADAPLDHRQFSVCFIADFTRAKVQEYVTRWFSLIDAAESDDVRASRIDSFLNESEAVSDLRSNPLLLALMCSIYRRQGFIPRNRADVYQQCADMLFDRWDRGRKIHVDRPLEPHLTPLLSEIARWMFTDPTVLAGATHRQLVERALLYIEREAIDEPQAAKDAAEKFVSYCHGRGWVLVGTGTNRDDEELYGFAHRTFLEFFSAKWIATSSSSNEALVDEIVPVVLEGAADTVALLAVQMRNEALRGAGNEVLSLILDHAGQSEGSRLARLLSFGAATLEYLVPRPTIVRQLMRLAVDEQLRIRRMAFSDPRLRDDELAYSVFERLEFATPESALVARAELGAITAELGTSELDLGEACVLTDFALNLGTFAGSRLSDVGDTFWSACGASIKRRAGSEPLLERTLLVSGKRSVRAALRTHGLGILIGDIPFWSVDDFTEVGYVDQILYWAFGIDGEQRNNEHAAFVRSRLRFLCRWMLTTQLPWVRGYRPPPQTMSWARRSELFAADRSIPLAGLEAAHQWAVVMLTLLSLQLMAPTSRTQSLAWLRTQEHPLLRAVGRLGGLEQIEEPDLGFDSFQTEVLVSVWSGRASMVQASS